MDVAKKWMGLGDENADAVKWENQCSLTKKQRLYGFVSCCGLGILMSFLSFIFWTSPTKFALIYTVGNIVAVASTGFLIGFWRQVSERPCLPSTIGALEAVSLAGALRLCEEARYCDAAVYWFYGDDVSCGAGGRFWPAICHAKLKAELLCSCTAVSWPFCSSLYNSVP
jgi:hypothetical protein